MLNPALFMCVIIKQILKKDLLKRMKCSIVMRCNEIQEGDKLENVVVSSSDVIYAVKEWFLIFYSCSSQPSCMHRVELTN